MNVIKVLLLTLLIALLLSVQYGCSTQRVVMKMPDRAPTELRLPCPPLEPLDETKPLLLGDLVQADAELALQYRECARKAQGWIDWEESVLGQ